MKKFWLALAISLFFYAKMDILIWQRIFETHQIVALGAGVYHWGWIQGLFGFMALGVILCYPSVRHMISYPLSLAVLAFSGLEDILYYVLDGKTLPANLPWLNSNPLILRPVTNGSLVISAAFWIAFVILLDIVGEYCVEKVKTLKRMKQLNILEEPMPSAGPAQGEA